MTQDTTKWEDATLGAPPDGWHPRHAAYEHQLRLEEIRATLEARMSVMGRRSGKDSHRRWHSSLVYLIDTWARLTGEDPEQGLEIEDPDLTTDLFALASSHRIVVIEEGTKAVTWAQHLGHRKFVNKMGFYLDREVGDLERIFGLS